MASLSMYGTRKVLSWVSVNKKSADDISIIFIVYLGLLYIFYWKVFKKVFPWRQEKKILWKDFQLWTKNKMALVRSLDKAEANDRSWITTSINLTNIFASLAFLLTSNVLHEVETDSQKNNLQNHSPGHILLISKEAWEKERLSMHFF